MPKPTERALARKPQAVVLFSWESGKLDAPAGDMDFEWFETDKGRTDYFDAAQAWNEQDVKDYGSLVYLTAEVTDTSSMTLGRVTIAPADNDELKAWMDRVTKDPSTLVAPSPQRAKSADTKKAVKPRKPSTAAQAVQKGGNGDGAPKPKQVRKPAKGRQAEAKSAPKGEAPDAKAANLKKRLAAKAAEKDKAAAASE